MTKQNITTNISCTIIIPTRDQLHFLKTCIESVLATSYNGNLEIIIIDNDSKELKTKSYLESIKSDARIKIFEWNEPFNFSRFNNLAAKHASGDVLCFLNNDIEVKSSDWLDKLVPIANHPDIGAVGTLLLYPNEAVQHAGVALDNTKVATHIGVGVPYDQLKADYMLDHLYTSEAVTAACMLTRKELFIKQGGFDEQFLAVSFNDVDYCLRLRQLGYLVVIYPAVHLIHHESVTRKSDDLLENRPRAMRERNFMKERWATQLAAARYDGKIPWQKSAKKTSTDSLLSKPQDVDSMILQLKTELLAQVDKGGLSSINTLNWEERYRLLEVEFRALESQARELETQLTLILHSRLWRLTNPVRLLFRILRSIKQRLASVLITTSFGKSLYALKHRANKINVRPNHGSPRITDSRLKHTTQASSKLDAFLKSSEEIVFVTSSPPIVSIILVLHNQAPLTLLCLQSLADNCDISIELIIVDNASSDQTVSLLKKIKNAVILRNSKNLKFVDALNQGIEKATGKYLLLFKNDALLQPRALSSAVSVIEASPTIGAVGGKIILFDGLVQEAGGIIWQDGNYLNYGQGQNAENPEFMFRREVDYCSKAFLLTPRKLFESLNGLDTDYASGYYEELDYCVRLQKNGYRIVYEPLAQIVRHEVSQPNSFAETSALHQEHRKIFCDKYQEFLCTKQVNYLANILHARTANQKKNLLYIDDRVPHPYLGAGYPRCQEILKELSAMEFNITFYPLLTSFDEWDKTYQTVPASIEVILYHGKSMLSNFLRERAGFYKFIIVSRNHNMKTFCEIIKQYPEVTQGCRIIYDAEAITAPREAAYLRLQGHTVLQEIEKKMIDKEIELARIADTIITVSKAEAAMYENAGYKKTIVLGHKLEISSSNNDFNSRRDFLFVGALRDDNSPNVDSLLWFAQEILPIIQQNLQENVTLFVAGDNTAPALKKLARLGIKFLGRQDNLALLYNRCRVFIAPTRFAAGIPHKIHEAAAYGIPVVSTSLLAQQLNWNNEEELLIANDPQHYAKQCLRLYQDKDLWLYIQNKAYSAVDRDCSPKTFRSQLQKIFMQ